MTSELAEADFHITIEPGSGSGLRLRSQAMADNIGQQIGRLAAAELARLNVALALAMGLAD